VVRRFFADSPVILAMRRLFTILAALSLVLFVATCVLWVWSYHASGRLYLVRNGLVNGYVAGEFYGIDVGSGKIVFSMERGSERRVSMEPDPTGFATPDPTGPPVWKFSAVRWNEPNPFGGSMDNWNRHAFGFRWKSKLWSSGIFGWRVERGLVCPIPFFAALTLILPASFILRRRLRQKRKTTHCIACGYDLRATRDRCPECGLVVERSAEKR